MKKVVINNKIFSSLTKACEEVGVSYASVRSYMTNHNVSAQEAILVYADGPKGTKGRSWTEDEKCFLKENAGVLTKKEIAENLKRTEGAVAKMANTLGLSLGIYHSAGPKKPFNGRPGWKPSEEAFLRDNYPEMNISQLAKHLGKAKNTVRTHLKCMGLYIPQP